VPAACIAAIWAAASTAAAGQRTATAEDDIKAAFLFNFTQFVEWPPSGENGRFRICTVAEPGFDAAVDRTVAGESVGSRHIVRSTPASPDDARDCQILFVGRQEGDRTEQWVSAVKGLPVLVVGESAAASQRGAHINFVLENNRVKFDVNNTAASRSGLVISSKLLRVARHVSTTEQP